MTEGKQIAVVVPCVIKSVLYYPVWKIHIIFYFQENFKENMPSHYAHNVKNTNTDAHKNSAQVQNCSEAKLSIKHLDDPFSKSDFVYKPRTLPFISVNGKQQVKQYILRCIMLKESV